MRGQKEGGCGEVANTEESSAEGPVGPSPPEACVGGAGLCLPLPPKSSEEASLEHCEQD